MFDRPDDHASLQFQLQQFIQRWHGYRKPWYGIDRKKLQETRLPDPLRWLYGYAGAWDGAHYWETLLGNQDCLVNFEDLYTLDGRLVFVNENQGVWCVGTERDGNDPPVWVHTDGNGWKILDESLMHFLTTFILHETVFGCQHLASCGGARSVLLDAGFAVVPLWSDASYPWSVVHPETPPLQFYLANGRYLIMDDWVATNEPEPWKSLPSIFEPKPDSQNHLTLDPWEAIPEHLSVPAIVKKSHLRTVVRRHEMEAEHHMRRASVFRRMLLELESGENHE